MKLQYVLLIVWLMPGISCTKYLDKKPNAALVIPDKTSDLQRLLDNVDIMNNAGSFLGEALADNYYVTAADYTSLPGENEKNIYSWGSLPFVGTSSSSHDWARLYSVVYYANVVLDALKKIEKNESNRNMWNELENTALFYRGRSHFEVLQLWAPFLSGSATSQAGIPLRLSSDFNIRSVRASLKQCIDVVLKDLQDALQYLPVQTMVATRPKRAAGFAQLARVYLYTADYEKALACADSCLRYNSYLLNYNDLNPAAAFPVPASVRAKNDEVIFHNTAIYFSVTANNRAKADSLLMSIYDSNDLRRTVFFAKNSNGTFYFKGSYNGNATPFTGIATDEVYLIKAECLARIGKWTEAMNILNHLLETRWKKGAFNTFNASSKEEALEKILLERRKELIWRGLRWQDIKRLNGEGRNIIQKRLVDNRLITLQPTASYYAMPIPDDVIEISGIDQNER